MKAQTLLVGIGSPLGDDQAGWQVAELLKHSADSLDLEICQASSPADLLHWVADCERLIVCDACHGAGPVGSIHRWTWPLSQANPVRWSGTHDITLPAALQLAQTLELLPESVVIWAVEGSDSSPGSSLTDEVADALSNLCEQVSAELVLHQA